MSYDAVILGAGAIGLCCAHYLEREGAHVIVLDSGTPGGGASSGNAGLVVPSHIAPAASPANLREGIKSLWSRHGAFSVSTLPGRG